MIVLRLSPAYVLTELLWWSVAASLLVLCACTFEYAARRRSAAFLHALWMCTAVCISIVPIASQWSPGVLNSDIVSHFWSMVFERRKSIAFENSAEIRAPDDAMASVRETGNNAGGTFIAGEQDFQQVAVDSAEPVLPALQSANSEPDRDRGLISVSAALVAVWLIGMCLGLLRLFVARIGLSRRFRLSHRHLTPQLNKLIRDATDDLQLKLSGPIALSGIEFERGISNIVAMPWRTVSVRIGPAEDGPLVFGWLPAKIILPKSFVNWSPEEQSAAIRHELSHVLRADELVRQLLLLLRCVCWFHPLVRYCTRRTLLFAEMACDDNVLRSGVRPSTYSSLILKLGRPSRLMFLDVASSGMACSEIATRIKSVVNQRRPRQGLKIGSLFAIVVFMMTAASACVLLRPQSLVAAETSQTVSESPAAVSVRRTSSAQFGGSASRNNVVAGTNSPTDWNIKSKSNIRWTAKLGGMTYGSPVVASGKVYIGTNNDAGHLARFPASIDLGVMLCFDERSGELLWQYSSPKLLTGRIHDWPKVGICSTPLVDSDRLWFVTNRGEVVCLDTDGFRDGSNATPYNSEESTALDEADVVWIFDMMKELGISQSNMSNCSVTSAGDLLFVNTSTGSHFASGNDGVADAPSFVCMNRDTGKVIWTDASPGRNILHGQWSSPAFGVLGGVAQVIFGGGDGYLYGFAAEGNAGEAELLWKFDCNPKASKYRLGSQGTRNNIIATPVIYDQRVYIAVGQDPEHGEGEGHLWCVDPTRRGDVSPTLVFNESLPSVPVPHRRWQALNPSEGEFEKANPNSAAIWHYTGRNRDMFEGKMHRAIGSVAIEDDLLFIVDFSGLVHCLDAATGNPHWTHDLLAQCWGTPLIVDGKVYLGDEDGDIAIFDRSKVKKLINEINVGSAVYVTPTYANETLFVASMNRLYAIKADD